MESASPPPSSVVIETSTPIPHFLLKLWKLVDDQEYSQAISWDKSGFSFHISDPFVFSKETLPLYFKHNNINSFVRLLNMYGFRKVTSIDRSGIKSDGSEQLEFQHPYFIKGHPELLQFIKRKASHPRAPSASVEVVQEGVTGLNQILEEVRFLREQQGKMTAKLSHLEKNNTRLWHEVAYMRSEHVKQKTLVNKLLQFLASMVHPGDRKRLGKRQLLMLADSVDPKKKRPSSSNQSVKISPKEPSSRPIIDDITDCSDSQDESEMSANGGISLGFDKDVSWINEGYAAEPMVTTPPDFALNDSEQVGSDISRKQEDAVQPATNNLPTALDHYTYPLPANKSPQIDEHLDFVQSDLDYLKDLLSSGTFDIDLDSLNSLFEADSLNSFEQSEVLTPQPLLGSPTKNHEPKTQIIGNEVSLHRVPAPLINWQQFPDATNGNLLSPLDQDETLTDPVISSAIVNSPSPPVLDEVVGFSPIVENSGYPGEKRLLLPSSNDFSSASVVPDSPLMTPPVTPMNQPAFISSGGGRKYQLRAPKNDRSPAVQVSISPSDRSKVSITTTASNQPGKSGRPLITIVSPGKTAPMTKRQQSH